MGELLTRNGLQTPFQLEYGMTGCEAHDMKDNVACKVNKNETFCAEPWCYVDPETCRSVRIPIRAHPPGRPGRGRLCVIAVVAVCGIAASGTDVCVGACSVCTREPHAGRCVGAWPFERTCVAAGKVDLRVQVSFARVGVRRGRGVGRLRHLPSHS